MKIPAWIINPRAWWRERQRLAQVRRDLLATPGVDYVVQEVMDRRYGIHNWRVDEGMLMAKVIMPGERTPWWGPIGTLHSVETRNWLTRIWCEMRGVDPPSNLSHAKPEPRWIPGDQADRQSECP